MGINELWGLVEKAKEIRSLADFAVTQGVEGPYGLHGLRMGLDISMWFRQAQLPFIMRSAQVGENAALAVIFHRLLRLFGLPIIVIVVFDGPDRPKFKRSKRVITKDHFLTVGTKALAEAFGFHTHQAPGEAEAELALMNAHNYIDAVMTDNSDTLVFGAHTIICNPRIKEDGEKITMYTSDAIVRAHPALTCGSLFLIALLCGGDYSKGLHGCGVVVRTREGASTDSGRTPRRPRLVRAGDQGAKGM